MGWTTTTAKFWKNGKIDRKKECEALFTQEEHEGTNYFSDKGEKTMYPQMRVLKSAMVGSIWYGAVESSYPTTHKKNPEVWCAVCITSTNTHYDEFGYKDMDESMGPCYYDCPDNILNLLSDTTNETALAWRKACREHKIVKNKYRKASKVLDELPENTQITFNSLFNMTSGIQKGDPVTLIKRSGKWCSGIYSWKKKFIDIMNYAIVQGTTL